MCESIRNVTKTPLLASQFFVGAYEDVLSWSAGYISIISDQNTQVKIYQSSDRNNWLLTNTINYSSTNTVVTQQFELTQRYVYLTLQNTSITNQSLLVFDVIYKDYFYSENTGLATSALQTTGNSSLASIVTNTSHLPASLGSTTSANSFPIVIASDQSAVAVSNASLPTIATNTTNCANIPTVSQKTMANSVKG